MNNYIRMILSSNNVFKVGIKVNILHIIVILISIFILLQGPNDQEIVLAVISDPTDPTMEIYSFSNNDINMSNTALILENDFQSINNLNHTLTQYYYKHSDFSNISGSQIEIYYLNDLLWNKITNDANEKTLIYNYPSELTKTYEVYLESENRVLNITKNMYSVPEIIANDIYLDLPIIFNKMELLPIDIIISVENGGITSGLGWSFFGSFFTNFDYYLNISSSIKMNDLVIEFSNKISSSIEKEGFSSEIIKYPLIEEINRIKGIWNRKVQGIMNYIIPIIIFLEILIINLVRYNLLNYRKEFLLLYLRGYKFSKLTKILWTKNSLYPILLNIVSLVLFRNILLEKDYNTILGIMAPWIVMHFFSTSYLVVRTALNFVSDIIGLTKKDRTSKSIKIWKLILYVNGSILFLSLINIINSNNDIIYGPDDLTRPPQFVYQLIIIFGLSFMIFVFRRIETGKSLMVKKKMDPYRFISNNFNRNKFSLLLILLFVTFVSYNASIYNYSQQNLEYNPVDFSFGNYTMEINDMISNDEKLNIINKLDLLSSIPEINAYLPIFNVLVEFEDFSNLIPTYLSIYNLTIFNEIADLEAKQKEQFIYIKEPLYSYFTSKDNPKMTIMQTNVLVDKNSIQLLEQDPGLTISYNFAMSTSLSFLEKIGLNIENVNIDYLKKISIIFVLNENLSVEALTDIISNHIEISNTKFQIYQSNNYYESINEASLINLLSILMILLISFTMIIVFYLDPSFNTNLKIIKIKYNTISNIKRIKYYIFINLLIFSTFMTLLGFFMATINSNIFVNKFEIRDGIKIGKVFLQNFNSIIIEFIIFVLYIYYEDFRDKKTNLRS